MLQNNLEAAEEIARQLRLRDIGGIIVIDFIDMEISKNREAVLLRLREHLAKDKTRTQVFDVSNLGLVEMTRKNVSAGLLESFSDVCPTCDGPRRGALRGLGDAGDSRCPRRSPPIRPETAPAEVEADLHRRIPLSAAMGVRVVSAAVDRVELTRPARSQHQPPRHAVRGQRGGDRHPGGVDAGPAPSRRRRRGRSPGDLTQHHGLRLAGHRRLRRRLRSPRRERGGTVSSPRSTAEPGPGHRAAPGSSNEDGGPPPASSATSSPSGTGLRRHRVATCRRRIIGRRLTAARQPSSISPAETGVNPQASM